MSQRTSRVDELLREEISQIISREVAGPAHRLRHDHGRGGHVRPSACHGVGLGHRRRDDAARVAARARTCHAVRARPARQAAHQAHPGSAPAPRRCRRARHAAAAHPRGAGERRHPGRARGRRDAADAGRPGIERGGRRTRRGHHRGAHGTEGAAARAGGRGERPKQWAAGKPPRRGR